MKERTRAKVLQRATRTSDVTRARTLALAALGAAVGAGAALAMGATPTGSERPLARPHTNAKIACATCHEAPENAPAFASAGACKNCHERRSMLRCGLRTKRSRRAASSGARRVIPHTKERRA